MNLLDIPILSTAVAIVISWALYALFCSYILEAWVQIKAERGRFMKNYLYQQLMDNINGINWADRIYSHGAIDLLSRDPKKPSNDISPKLFAETLIEVVGSSHVVQSGINTFAGPTVGYQSTVIRDFKYGTLILNASDVVTLFRQAMNYAELKAKKNADGNIDEAELHDYLVGYFENWFNEFTQRLTLWYKKQTRERLFYLGAVMAVIINVDSLQLFTFYENNPKAAAEVIRFYKENPNLEKDSTILNHIKASKELIPVSNEDRKVLDSLIHSSTLSCDTKTELSASLREEIPAPNKKYLDSLYNTIGRSALICGQKLKYQEILTDSFKIPDAKTVQLVNTAIDSSTNKTIIDSMKTAFSNQMRSKLSSNRAKIINTLVQTSKLEKQKKIYFGHLLNLKSSPALNYFTSRLDSLVVATKLPVSWKYNILSKRVEMDFWDYAIKILGLLISGFAASFGAPFWFDLLKKATSKT